MLSRHRPPPRQRALLHRLSRQFDELASATNALKAENEHLRAVAEAAALDIDARCHMCLVVRSRTGPPAQEGCWDGGRLCAYWPRVEALRAAGYLKESVHDTGTARSGDGTTDADKLR